ncbi:hypothetical protein CEXT_76741 [Caerostris extrusa]|uniref:Uncharacterized protein n=1 Tax=Caerostris extrusa TaxID=172846 RepID=A0AAV4QPY6_CAEEX|nr:hypothetical protein CEXT_76741 [Caerostris extrusa]
MQDTEIDNLPEPRKLIIKPDTFFLINPEASKIPTSDDALPEKFHHQQIATLKYLLTFNSSCRNLGGPELSRVISAVIKYLKLINTSHLSHGGALKYSIKPMGTTIWGAGVGGTLA